MEIIPVIDVMRGVVVRARHGDRAGYRPIETPLSQTAEPLDVVAGLLALHPFSALYVADLDSIEGRGESGAVLDRVATTFPALNLWVDDGCSDARRARAFMARYPAAFLVLGSESQSDCRTVEALRDEPRVILSLDFRGDVFQGPPALLGDPDFWPHRVILMTLARVGGDAGPDFERLAAIRALAGARPVYLAGGLRGGGDLARLAANGAAGVLAASALHDGRLSAGDLADAAEQGRA